MNVLRVLRQSQKVMLVFAVSLLLVLLSACGGGESGTGLQSTHQATVQGPVTGLGGTQLSVGGVEFDTAGADITMDEVNVSTRDLEIGMVVTVKGSVEGDGSGVAHTIVFEHEIKGIVSANNLLSDGTGTLEVMGQSVEVTADTYFLSSVAGIDAVTKLAVNTSVVEVSGYNAGDGKVVATYIKLENNNGRLAVAQVRGNVSQLMGNNAQVDGFNIGNLNVAVDDTTRFQNLQEADLRDGLFVKVKSTQFPMDALQITAANIKEHRPDYGDDGDEVKLEGIVTQALLDGRFMLGEQLIQVDDNTQIEPEGVVINVGVHLEVEAYVVDGGLLAKKIKQQNLPNDRVIVRSDLEAKDSIAGTFKIMGALVETNEKTRIDANISALADYASPAELPEGVEVVHASIKFYLLNEGGVERRIATSVQYDGNLTKPDKLAVIVKSVDSAAQRFSVLGMDVLVDFAGASGIAPDENHAGLKLDIKGNYDVDNMILIADEISL